MSSAIISKSRSTRTSSIAGTPNSRCPEFYAVPATDAVGAIRSSARSFEESLPPAQGKRLGQFFTGLPLGALLAHLALDPVARSEEHTSELQSLMRNSYAGFCLDKKIHRSHMSTVYTPADNYYYKITRQRQHHL